MIENRALDNPALYQTELNEEQRQQLLAWINANIHQFEMRDHSSYTLKHEFEWAAGGFYLTNGAFKGAMVAAGYEVTNLDADNWKFKQKAK